MERFVRDPENIKVGECLLAIGYIVGTAMAALDNDPNFPEGVVKDALVQIKNAGLQFHTEGFKEQFPVEKPT